MSPSSAVERQHRLRNTIPPMRASELQHERRAQEKKVDPTAEPLTDAERERQRRLRKIRKKLGGPLTIDTDLPESIHSDEPDAPTSPVTMSKAVVRHGLPVELVFPSLRMPTRLLRQMTRPEQLDELGALVPVFCNCVDSIRRSILSDLFCDMLLLADCIIYKTLNSGIYSASLQLHTYVDGLVHTRHLSTAESMLEAQQLVEDILQQLPALLRLSETFHRTKTKPLPPVPPPDTQSPSARIEAWLAASDALAASKSSPESSTSDATGSVTLPGSQPAPAQTTPKGNKHKLIRHVLHIGAEPLDKSKPRSTENTPPGDESPATPSPIRRFLQKRAPLAVADPDAVSFNSSTTTLVPPQENPYIVRQSFIYDCHDPLRPQEKVTMPLPTGDTVAIRLDSSGGVKAASLPALVQLLTSHHDLGIPDLSKTFFLSFRIFSSPQQVLRAILARWDEPPPDTGDPLTEAQARVWLAHMYHVHNCLARLLLAWLDEYWRPAQDQWVLPPLREFIQLRFPYMPADEMNPKFIPLIFAALSRAEQQEQGSRLQRAKEVKRQGAPPASLPFEFHPADDYTLNISVFETAQGRERFAAQITDLAHGFFCRIDPEDAVANWVKGVVPLLDLQKFEEELLYWVVASILMLKSREERVAMIEFWLDVAIICLRLRNFSSAHSIFGGLVFTPIERLSLTILEIAISSKEQYRKLNAIFNGANNYSIYRRALAEDDMPAVPLITVLRKDVVSAKEISGPVALTNDPDADKTLIHFAAFRMLKKTICTMEKCLVQYNIEPVPVIQDWIRKQLAVLPHADHGVLSEEMDKLSCALEPRAPPPIQKGMTWLQTMTGSVESGVFTLHTLPDPGAAPPAPAPKLRKNKSIATLLNLRMRWKA